MSENLIDASVILAILKDEAIDEHAYAVVDGGVMSSVKVAEVYTKLSEFKMLTTRHVDALLDTLSRVEPFTRSQARVAGFLRDSTRHAGHSLRDWCCLALGLELDANVYTTEQAWAQVDVGCCVQLLR